MTGSPHLRKLRQAGCALLWIAFCAGISSCRSPHQAGASIQIAEVPPASPGGPAQMDFISGRVAGSRPDQQVVLYAHSDMWWIQPTASHPFTRILPDSTWKNATHLGESYAALLVDPDYHPASKIAALPPIGNGVEAIAVASGRPGLPVVHKVIHFSGYDWSARTAASARGGESNAYDPSNAWVDAQGRLHLRMGPENGQWTCAEIFLRRSLGYGTYSFLVEDTVHMEPSAVLGMFTLGDERADSSRKELDVEISQWGNPSGHNAQYVVQPYYIAQNTFHFAVPAGKIMHTFRWEPDSASFTSYRAPSGKPSGAPISHHIFTSGIPSESGETVHIDLYDFHHSRNALAVPTEIVIDRFEFLP